MTLLLVVIYVYMHNHMPYIYVPPEHVKQWPGIYPSPMMVSPLRFISG